MNARHVGIILDGNRRFAKKKMLKPWEGHEFGAQAVRNLLYWGKECGISMLTLYCFSIENFKRSPKEVNVLMELFIKTFTQIKDSDELHANKMRICFIGKRDLFSDEIQKLMHELEEDTKQYTEYQANFAMAYGGRTEIVDAVKHIVAQGTPSEQITEELLSKHMYLNDAPDLIIRTSGELRMSGFLLWQSAYSEFYFTETLWPEFTKEELQKALEEFSHRKRRFGK